jgi:hypothetical protein
VGYLCRGDWQKSLATGTEAWDGSTIRDVTFIRDMAQRVPENDQTLFRHIENRLKWTAHLRERIEEAGFQLRQVGPSVRIERSDGFVFQPMVEQMAAQEKLSDIPVIFHSIEQVGSEVGQMRIYKCVITSRNQNAHAAVRAERWIIGGIDFTREICAYGGTSCFGRMTTTERKARNLAKRVSRRLALYAADIREWTERRLKCERETAERQEAAEAEQRAKDIEADADALAGAFA